MIGQEAVGDDITNAIQQQIYNRLSSNDISIHSLTRIMRSVLPPNAKISNDAKEAVQHCVTEFISFITSEATQKCDREYRRTIRAEDVISAMEALGFHDYKEPLDLFLKKYRMRDQQPDQHDN
ncbi:hypothetical protein ACJIZ3_010540 [Penstemon smallii]|uniref:Transcription factor CBF/NF-Y/archaeal histone domain-containing protein n=1 Tax=Penstemon smallii TaxID=265156 RepID=A0ABD3UKN2_9LAMI